MRMYNDLDPSAKSALNQAFLSNIKSGRNHQTFHKALEAHINQPQERQKVAQAIDQIFPIKLANAQQKIEKQIAKAYLRQTESSINKRNLNSNAKNRKKKSVSRDREPRAPRPPLASNTSSKKPRQAPYFIQTNLRSNIFQQPSTNKENKSS